MNRSILKKSTIRNREKRVTFDSEEEIFLIPSTEERSGAHWILDSLRFQQRIKAFEDIFKKIWRKC